MGTGTLSHFASWITSKVHMKTSGNVAPPPDLVFGVLQRESEPLWDCSEAKKNMSHQHLASFQSRTKTAGIIFHCLPSSNHLGSLRKE